MRFWAAPAQMACAIRTTPSARAEMSVFRAQSFSSEDRTQAAFIRQNCQDLAAPQPIGSSGLQFASNDPTVFQLNGQVFNRQTDSPSQTVTTQFCSASNTEALICREITGSPALFGVVNQSGVDETGTLNVQESSGPPLTYQSMSGQSSQFALTLSGQTSASLTYSIGGGPQASVSGMLCASQSIPVYNDGSQNAPAGTPQLPNLLSAYNVRPPWKVAGVDYAVGYPAGQTLKDPTTDPALLSNPNISVDTVNHLIRIGGDNVVLNGYDFTLHGGYGIYVSSGTGTLVENSNVSYIQAMGASSNLTAQYCIFDGTNTPSDLAMIFNVGTGSLNVSYNWFKNVPVNVINENTSGSLSLKYNLIENPAAAYTEFVNATYNSISIDFNTTYQALTSPTPPRVFAFMRTAAGRSRVKFPTTL